MPRAYWADLRERVIKAIGEGAPRQEAAERLDASASPVIRWLQSWREEGLCGPKPRGGSRSTLDDCADEILALVREHPRFGGFWSATTSALKRKR
jgi:transposase